MNSMELLILGTFVLDNILPINTIEARFPKDIVLFEQNTVWYAVALISESPIQDAYAMQIYKKIVSMLSYNRLLLICQ